MSGSTSSSLCLKCGLCCNGALYTKTYLRPSDVDDARGLGLIVDVNEGRPAFRQPCQLYRDGRCSVFSRRPHTCRVYECKLLKSYRTNQVTFEEGSQRIARAKALLTDLEALLPGGYTVQQMRHDIGAGKDSNRGLFSSAVLRRANAAVLLANAKLTFYLHKYFAEPTAETGKPSQHKN